MAYLSVVIYQKDLLIKPLTYRKGITALVIPLVYYLCKLNYDTLNFGHKFGDFSQCAPGVAATTAVAAATDSQTKQQDILHHLTPK